MTLIRLFAKLAIRLANLVVCQPIIVLNVQIILLEYKTQIHNASVKTNIIKMGLMLNARNATFRVSNAMQMV